MIIIRMRIWIMLVFFSCTGNKGSAPFQRSCRDSFSVQDNLYRFCSMEKDTGLRNLEVWKKGYWEPVLDSLPGQKLWLFNFDYDNDSFADLAFFSGPETEIFFYDRKTATFDKSPLSFLELIVIDSVQKIYCIHPPTVLAFNTSSVFSIRDKKEVPLFALKGTSYDAYRLPDRFNLYRYSNGQEKNAILLDSFALPYNKFDFPYESFWKNVLKKHGSPQI